MKRSQKVTRFFPPEPTSNLGDAVLTIAIIVGWFACAAFVLGGLVGGCLFLWTVLA